jgi:hypothetical protein
MDGGCGELVVVVHRYRKNTLCRAAILYRALSHGKEGFNVRGHNDAWHTQDVRQRRRKTHGKEAHMAKEQTNTRQVARQKSN